MQLFTIVSALLLTTLAVARDSQITFQDDNLKVPGNNPLEYCQDPSDYQLDLDSVDLDPNPPEAYVWTKFHMYLFQVVDARRIHPDRRMRRHLRVM